MVQNQEHQEAAGHKIRKDQIEKLNKKVEETVDNFNAKWFLKPPISILCITQLWHRKIRQYE